jgi:hypothetical protein
LNITDLVAIVVTQFFFWENDEPRGEEAKAEAVFRWHPQKAIVTSQ